MNPCKDPPVNRNARDIYAQCNSHFIAIFNGLYCFSYLTLKISILLLQHTLISDFDVINGIFSVGSCDNKIYVQVAWVGYTNLIIYHEQIINIVHSPQWKLYVKQNLPIYLQPLIYYDRKIFATVLVAKGIYLLRQKIAKLLIICFGVASKFPRSLCLNRNRSNKRKDKVFWFSSATF